MSKLLTQDRIKELILAKEERNVALKHEEEVESENTQKLFLKIKDDFLNYTIEDCILRGYELGDYDIAFCTSKAIDSNYGLELKAVSLLDYVILHEDKLGKFEPLQLMRSLSDLLTQNGFKLEFRHYRFIYSTSKEALLRLSEPNKDFDVGKIGFIQNCNYGEESEKNWAGLFLVVIVISIVLGFIFI